MTPKNKSSSKRVHAGFPYAISLALVALVTFAGEFVKRSLEPANLVMPYLLAVVIVAVRWGRGPAAVTSFLSVLAFDFFLVPPYLTFGVQDLQYFFTFAGLLAVGLIISEFTAKTRKLELLRETEKFQTALLNSISHDLRTPLVSITGSLSILRHDASWLDEDTKKELVENAFEDSARLNRIVGNLLDMTRVEAGALKVNPKPCELRDVIGVSFQELQQKLVRRMVEVRIPHDFPEVLMDFSLMVKVFFNLLDNAAKYSPGGGPIRIEAKVEKNKAQIEISDEGIGIGEEDLKRIFDKFYRASRTAPISGTGLGLSICKGIVEAHHGEIRAESSPAKKGSVFVVLLPLSQDIL